MISETPKELQFDPWQFYSRAMPASCQTKIDCSDYQRMGTELKTSLVGKQMWVPKFAFDDSKLRAVITQIAEGFKQFIIHDARQGDWKELDSAITAFIIGRTSEGLPEQEKATIDQLKRAVQKAGTYFAMYVGVAYHFWRRSQDCVTVARLLDMTPAQVRAMARRMVVKARALGFETFDKPHWSVGSSRNKKQWLKARRASFRRKLYGRPDYIEGFHCWQCRVNPIDHARNKWRCEQCLKNYNYSERVRLRRARRAEKQKKAAA